MKDVDEQKRVKFQPRTFPGSFRQSRVPSNTEYGNDT